MNAIGTRSISKGTRLTIAFSLGILAIGLLAIAVALQSAVRFVLIPVSLVILACAGASLPGRRHAVTPQQLAEELEKHLNGTEGAYDWDDITSRPIADERLDALRAKLTKFDSLVRQKKVEEFKEIMAALRRGEIPEVRDE